MLTTLPQTHLALLHSSLKALVDSAPVDVPVGEAELRRSGVLLAQVVKASFTYVQLSVRYSFFSKCK
jgi:hypothetical protein